MKSKEEKIREYLAEIFKHGSKVDLTVSKKGKKATLIIGGILNNLMARVIFDYISGLGIDIEYAVENKQSTKKEQSKDIAEIINERIYNIKNGLSNDPKSKKVTIAFEGGAEEVNIQKLVNYYGINKVNSWRNNKDYISRMVFDLTNDNQYELVANMVSTIVNEYGYKIKGFTIDLPEDTYAFDFLEESFKSLQKNRASYITRFGDKAARRIGYGNAEKVEEIVYQVFSDLRNKYDKKIVKMCKPEIFTTAYMEKNINAVDFLGKSFYNYCIKEISKKFPNLNKSEIDYLNNTIIPRALKFRYLLTQYREGNMGKLDIMRNPNYYISYINKFRKLDDVEGLEHTEQKQLSSGSSSNSKQFFVEYD